MTARRPRKPGRIAALLAAMPTPRPDRLPTLLAAVLLALFATAGAPALPAQQAHVYVVKGGSSSSAFEDVTGVGVGLTFGLADWMRIQATLDTRESRFRRMGQACTNPAVGYDCITEEIDTVNRFSSVTATALPTWWLGETVRMGVGAGVVLGNAGSDNRPDSGRRARIFQRLTAHLGAVALADLQVQPVPSVPVMLVGQYQARFIDLNGCAADARVYTPFCGADWWSELQVGVGVRF